MQQCRAAVVSVLVMACAVLSACGTSESSPAAVESQETKAPKAKPKADPPMKVDVPVTKATPDVSYVLQPKGTATNEKYSDGTYGVVVVQARRGDSTSNRGPLPEGRLELQDGSAVRCEKFRPTVWSDFDAFEGLDLKCDSRVDLTAVVRFVVD